MRSATQRQRRPRHYIPIKQDLIPGRQKDGWAPGHHTRPMSIGRDVHNEWNGFAFSSSCRATQCGFDARIPSTRRVSSCVFMVGSYLLLLNPTVDVVIIIIAIHDRHSFLSTAADFRETHDQVVGYSFPQYYTHGIGPRRLGPRKPKKVKQKSSVKYLTVMCLIT